MKELIRWLREIEHLANEIYLQSAFVFADDSQFRSFLEHNADVKNRDSITNIFTTHLYGVFNAAAKR